MADITNTILQDVTLASLSSSNPTFIVEMSNGDQITLPTPKYNISYQKEDLQLDAWRDEAGYLHKVEARRKLRRVNLEWSYLSDAQMRLLDYAFKTQDYLQSADNRTAA